MIEKDKDAPDPKVVNRFHQKADTDSNPKAIHHTLGPKRNQASPGNHTHDGTSSLKIRAVSAAKSTSTQLGITTETQILSVSHEFAGGRAYRISYNCRVQINGGTSPFGARPRVRRSNAAGTLIHDPTVTMALTTNFVNVRGWVDVKRSSTSPTTQTIALTMDFSPTGGPTSIDVEAATTAPTLLIVEELGSADDYDYAFEVPTS